MEHSDLIKETLRRAKAEEASAPFCESCGVNRAAMLWGRPIVAMPSGEHLCHECMSKGGK